VENEHYHQLLMSGMAELATRLVPGHSGQLIMFWNLAALLTKADFNV